MGKKTVLVLFLLFTLLLFASCSDESTPNHTTADGNTLVTVPQTSLDGNKDTPLNLSYTTNINLSEGGITVPSGSFVSGTLLSVNDEQAFRYNVASLLAASDIASSVSVFNKHSLVRLYGKKSQNYLLASSQIFLKEDAFQPWEDLMAAFVTETSKKNVQVVSAYVYNGEDSLYSPFVTGYSLAINLYENGANYSLASSEITVTVNGKTMTCLDWFQDNCFRYGFVYTGLEGDQAKTLATFRYVGIPHALVMQKLDYVDTQEYTEFLCHNLQTYVLSDFENDITWNIGFYPADKNQALTQIAIPKGAVYTVSGDNVDGFIVAYYMPES